jgi:tetratricopeptide (TPR) repeat protein
MTAYPPAILGQILLAAGDDDEGRVLVEQSITLAERHHDTQALCLALPALAEHAVLTGHAEEAVALLESRLDTVRYSFFGHSCAASLAGAYVLTGRLEEAERLLIEQMKGENARTNRTALPGLLRAGGMMHAQQDRWAEAEELFLQAAEVAKMIRYPLAEAVTLLEHGRTALDHGALEKAQTKLRDALVIFERLEAAPYAGRTRELLALL